MAKKYNLLIGTGTTVNSDTYLVVKYKTTESLVVGNIYTISAYVEELEREGKKPNISVSDGKGYWTAGKLKGDIPGVNTRTFTYKHPYPDHTYPNQIRF